jgi:8-oxo-dGTP diphosphatase
VVPAAYLYLIREVAGTRQVLLQLRGDVPYRPRHWAAGAAGHVDVGEAAHNAAAREAQEEIGVHAVVPEFLCAVQRSAGADPIDERIDFYFTAQIWQGEPTILEPHKCLELGWFALDALPEPLVPHERVVLTRWAGGELPPYFFLGPT